ncbi:hypothetical protein [Companilactobacillus ginsenosidimutans]|uniref:Peptidase M10 metallopeptidase domain-containing protein n=1 Tax=Companilactobacillus ginsenosidimutans TaxID=1007676 RepID=A0A0H4QI48_9LACO|nr:hypothetical protein [Companilactobacillus ginsenosidimutans]AKP67617.1 hypothetical protein ABM34_08790 [Companilactobacillus ginsenosidimutans]
MKKFYLNITKFLVTVVTALILLPPNTVQAVSKTLDKPAYNGLLPNSNIYANKKLPSLENIKVYIDPKLSTNEIELAKYAIDAWDHAIYKKLTYKLVPSPNNAQIIYTSEGTLTDRTAGQTVISYEGNTIIKATIQFNFHDELHTYDKVNVTNHEMGHALGLIDLTDPAMKGKSVMYFSNDGNVTGPTPFDISNVKALYNIN